MNDRQILTLILTLLGIFSASWYNNGRITDMKDLIRSEINGVGSEMKSIRTEMKLMHVEIDSRFSRLEATIERNQETIMRMLADHDQRITKLEDGKRA